jgi:hypothetical protein
MKLLGKVKRQLRVFNRMMKAIMGEKDKLERERQLGKTS